MIHSVRRTLLLALAIGHVTLSTAGDLSLPQTVRVRILAGADVERVVLEAPDDGLAIHDANSTGPVATVPGGAEVIVRSDRGDVRLEWSDRVLQGDRFALVPTGAGATRVRAGEVSRAYMGAFRVSASDGLALVNVVDLEHYVASVVSSEYGLDDLEGTKAMAVVARTYAVKRLQGTDRAWDLSDDVGSQVYRGAGSVTQIARIAAQETHGEILTYDGEPIEAVYSSSSGGRTASNEDVWNSAPVPYLRGRDDPWDRDAPHHEWTWSVERDRLHETLSNGFDLRVRSIRVEDRSPDGRVRTVRLENGRGDDRLVTASDFRSTVVRSLGGGSLRSSLFEVAKKDGRYVFEGNGFGHGVGLSQWGAHGMSLAGRSYGEILDYYYTDVRLERRQIDSTDDAAPDPVYPVLADARDAKASASAWGVAVESPDGREAAGKDARMVPQSVRVDHDRPPVQAWGSRTSQRELAADENRTNRRRVGW